MQIGVDVGGTNTDGIILSNGKVLVSEKTTFDLTEGMISRVAKPDRDMFERDCHSLKIPSAMSFLA